MDLQINSAGYSGAGGYPGDAAGSFQARGGQERTRNHGPGRRPPLLKTGEPKGPQVRSGPSAWPAGDRRSRGRVSLLTPAATVASAVLALQGMGFLPKASSLPHQSKPHQCGDRDRKPEENHPWHRGFDLDELIGPEF